MSHGQLKMIKGKVIANGDVEGIHLLNKTSVKFDVTDIGGNFEVLAKVSDTLVITGIKYETKSVIISSQDYDKAYLNIYLTEKVNELDEVIVGKILTGNIGSDIGNVDIKDDVNFYDLGIPGYTGKPKTIPERKLADADAGKWGYVGIGFGINFHKLLNKISGRTKKLKANVALEKSDKCMRSIRDFYTKMILEDVNFTEAQTADYFYFCMDDERFINICKRNDPTEVIPFLQEKLATYKLNLKSNDD